MTTYILFVIGFIFLIKGADYLVDGASTLAKKLGISTLIIGLTIVAFGTSLPEFIINIFSALEGKTNISLGNIIGSNISNILLILGVVSLIKTLSITHSIVWKEIPFNFVATLILFIAANDIFIDNSEISILSQSDGCVLLVFFAIFMYYIFISNDNSKTEKEDEMIEIKEHSYLTISLMIVGGIVGLWIGGAWVINGAIKIATAFGLSEFMISATILALGSSLPELVTSLVAIKKNDSDLSIGNIVGSNIFNICWVLAISALITPLPITENVNINLFYLLGITLLLFLFMFITRKKRFLYVFTKQSHQLERWQGLIFLFMYGIYIGYLVSSG